MLQIVKRQDMSPKRANLLRAAMVVVALLAAGLIILILGYNPITVYANIFKGAVTNNYRLTQTIHKAIPLTVLSLVH